MGASSSVPGCYPVGVTDVDTGDRYDIPFEIFVNPHRDMTRETAKPTFPANGTKLFASAAGTFPFANGSLDRKASAQGAPQNPEPFGIDYKAKAEEARAATASRVWNARKKAGDVVDKAIANVEKSSKGKSATKWYREWQKMWGKPYLTADALADVRRVAGAAAAAGLEEGGPLPAAFDAQTSVLLSVAPSEAKVKALQNVAEELVAEATVLRQEAKYYSKLRTSADNKLQGFQAPRGGRHRYRGPAPAGCPASRRRVHEPLRRHGLG